MTIDNHLNDANLGQYKDILIENGFDTMESLASIPPYFDQLGIKLGHRKAFEKLIMQHSPELQVMVTFLTLTVDTGAHWGWSSARTFHPRSMVKAWPVIMEQNIQNMRVGRLGVQEDGTVKFANNREDNKAGPERCHGEVVYRTTLLHLVRVGYDISAWKPFAHKLSIE